MDEALADRVVGCVLGLALGDALGAPFEFKRREEVPHPLPALELPSWTGEPPGSTTDDTAMARHLVRSLAEQQGFDPDDLIARHLAWFATEPPDVGSLTRRVLARAARGQPAPEAARAVWEERGPEVSAGNGSVMYCAPLGAAYANRPAELRDLAPVLSALTHFDERCRTAVLAVTLTAAGLVWGEPASDALGEALTAALEREGGEELEFLTEAAGTARRIDGPDMGFCLFTAGAGLQAVARLGAGEAGGFAEELERVVGFGGDTDTNGAVAGALLGAALGRSGLPEPWLARLRDAEAIEAEASALVPLASGRTVPRSRRLGTLSAAGAARAGGGASMGSSDSPRRKRVIRAVQVLVSIAVVALIFVGILPRIADYRDVWAALADLTAIELGSLLLITFVNLATYWPVMTASMPGLTLAQAAVNNQTSTTIANTIPGGGAVAVGITYAMYRSWGFTNSQIALTALVTGVWNTFIKLALPVVALAVLALEGNASGGLVLASLIGVAVLAVAVVGFGLMLWRERFARAIGGALGRAVSVVRRLLRRPPVGWAEAAAGFRGQTIQLVSGRWVPLTAATIVSHLALYGVLLVALRHVGVSQAEVSWAQVLGVFAFVRLLSAVPITPGGLGVVELGYIGGLVLAGEDHADVTPELFRAQVAAAVLLFRALTYGLQIPLGGLTYVVWRRTKRWMKPAPIGSQG